MNIPENLAEIAAYLNQASECLRAASLLATQKNGTKGIAVRLRKMDVEAAQYAEYITTYFAAPLEGPSA